MIVQRYFWVINLIGISFISYLLADIAGQVISNKIRQHATSSSVSDRNNKSSSVNKERRGIKYAQGHYDLIFSKNIFRKNIEEDQPVEEKIIPAVTPNHPDNDIPASISKLNFSLVGTALKGGKGYMAFLEDKKSKKQKEYWIGDKITDNAILVNISRESIIIERNGKREIIEYTPFGKQKKGAAARPNQRGRSSKGVTNISERSWVLDKRYIDKELRDMGKLMTQIRAVPSGKKGFKVFNIKRNSMFDKIGLKNGDLVERINGVQLSSPDKAIEMYQQLQGATEIQIDIKRGGSTHTYNYSIQ